MLAFLRNIFGFLIAVALLAFALGNRQQVEVLYSPVHEALELPLYLITLGFLGAGFFLGGLSVWINSAHLRKTRRKQMKAIKELEKDLETLKPASKTITTPSSELFPALPDHKN